MISPPQNGGIGMGNGEHLLHALLATLISQQVAVQVAMAMYGASKAPKGTTLVIHSGILHALYSAWLGSSI